MTEKTCSRDDVYKDPHFLDDLVASLREGGRKRYEDLQKSVRLSSYREDVYFVHGLDNHESPWATPTRAFNYPYKGPKDRLAYLLTVQPAICVSHVKGDKGLWSSAGVILQDGVIVFASSFDFGTDRNQRNKLTKNNVDLRTIKNVCSQTTGKYSEFVVKNPTPAGLYLAITQTEDGLRVNTRDGHYNQYKIFAEEWNLPLYALFEGELFTFTQLADRTLQLGEKLTKQQVLERKITLPQERYKREQERVLTSDGFVVGNWQDAELFASWKNGGNVFSDLHRLREMERTGEHECYGHEYERLAWKYKMYKSLERFSGLVDDTTFVEMPFGYVELKVGSYRSFGFYRNFTSPDHVLDVLEDVVEQLDAIRSFTEKNKEKLRWIGVQGMYDLYGAGDPEKCIITGRLYASDDLPMGAYFYGFAEEARKAGRLDLSERAEALAQKLLPKAEITSLVDKRLAPNGGFRTYVDEVRMPA
jgi:hypothetical protein